MKIEQKKDFDTSLDIDIVVHPTCPGLSFQQENALTKAKDEVFIYNENIPAFVDLILPEQKAKIEKLQTECDVLHYEKRRDALLGQSTMDECNNTIIILQSRLDEAAYFIKHLGAKSKDMADKKAADIILTKLNAK